MAKNMETIAKELAAKAYIYNMPASENRIKNGHNAPILRSNFSISFIHKFRTTFADCRASSASIRLYN